MELTKEQQSAIVAYLKSKKEFDTNNSKTGYSQKLSSNVKQAVSELKKLFSIEEFNFLTSAAYLPELEKHFLGGK